MQIVTVPDKVLHKKVKPVHKIDQRIRKIAAQMIKILRAQKDPEGVGLAAPQVGLSISMFVIDPDKTKKPKVFINAKILDKEHMNEKTKRRKDENIEKNLDENTKKQKDEKTKIRKYVKTKKQKNRPVKLEGCLSMPTIWGKVDRSSWVKVQFQTLDGELKTEKFSGFEATIIQHEVDHLHGVLFTKHCLSQGYSLFKEQDGELEEYEI